MAKRSKKRQKPKCKKGFSCGFSCIGRNRTCRSNLDKKGKKIVEDYAQFLRRTTKPKKETKGDQAEKEAFKAQLRERLSDSFGLNPTDTVKTGNFFADRDTFGRSAPRLKNLGVVLDEDFNVSSDSRVSLGINGVERYLKVSPIGQLYADDQPDPGLDPLKTLFIDAEVISNPAGVIGGLRDFHEDDIPIGFTVAVQNKNDFALPGLDRVGETDWYATVKTKDGFRPFEDGDRKPNTKEKLRSILERSNWSAAMEDEAGDGMFDKDRGINSFDYIMQETETLNRIGELEDLGYNRGPSSGKYKDPEILKTQARRWAKSQGFDLDAGANGFTNEQTLAHDVAHPATHILTGLETDDFKEVFGLPNIAFEEGVVNMFEHLSRGDSLAGSVLNAVRLTKVLLRADRSSDAYQLSRTPEYADVLTTLGKKGLSHPDFRDIMEQVREANIKSTTVLTSGFDFRGTARG